MAEPFLFELVSPEKLLVSDEATSVIVPSVNGYFTMMTKHTPVISILNTGIVDVKKADGSEEKFFVQGGYADVSPTGCTILAEFASPLADMKLDEIEQEIRNTEEDVDDAKDEENRKKAEIKLEKLKETYQVVKAA